MESAMPDLTAVLHKEEDMYVAHCPQAGTTSQGRTVEEALEALKEATRLYLEEFPLQDMEPPIVITFSIKQAGDAGAETS